MFKWVKKLFSKKSHAPVSPAPNQEGVKMLFIYPSTKLDNPVPRFSPAPAPDLSPVIETKERVQKERSVISFQEWKQNIQQYDKVRQRLLKMA